MKRRIAFILLILIVLAAPSGSVLAAPYFDTVVEEPPLGGLRCRRQHPEPMSVLGELLDLHVGLIRRALKIGDGVVGIRAVRIACGLLSARPACGEQGAHRRPDRRGP